VASLPPNVVAWRFWYVSNQKAGRIVPALKGSESNVTLPAALAALEHKEEIG
jgi:hypothetical protein